MTKIQTYISNISSLIENKGALLGAIEHATLRETQTFLSSLELLISANQPILGLQESVAASGQLPLMSHAYSNHSMFDGFAKEEESLQKFAYPLQTSAPAVLAPIPMADQPVAVKLSSLTTPTVDGCIAAMPQEVKQSAAQAQLNEMLGTKVAVTSLEDTLRKQMEAAAAVPVQQSEYFAPDAPAQQLKLEDLLAATAAKEQAEQQAIFDAVLKQQITGTVKMTPEGLVVVGGSIEASAPIPQMNSVENASPIQAPL